MTTSTSFTAYSRRLLAFIERANVAEDVEFASLACELFALQFDQVASYRRLCEVRQVAPGTLTDWRQIPAIPTAAFKELELTSLLPVERTTVFHSSGTTEQFPSRHFHNAESLAVYEASLVPWFARHVFHRYSDSKSPTHFLCLAPPPTQAPHSSLVHMFATVSHAFGASRTGFAAIVGTDHSWSIDFAAAYGALSHAERSGEPLLLLGTAFMFVNLLDALSERGLFLKLPSGSRVMETGGYKGRSRELPKTELHKLISSRLGVPRESIVCEYGMSELSSQAYSLISDRSLLPFTFPPWARALVVSPETGREVIDGETGLLRIFDLANVRSVMAIQTEDLAVRWGNGFELLGRAAKAEPRGCSLMAA